MGLHLSPILHNEKYRTIYGKLRLPTFKLSIHGNFKVPFVHLASLEDLATITAILKNKYGQSEQKETIFRFQDGNRSVIASCDQEGGDNSRKTYKLKVTYEDRSLLGGADAL